MARRPALLLAAMIGALVAPVASVAVDVNGDDYLDAYSREVPNYPKWNVGANCDVWRYNSPLHARLYVRPPIVWGLPALGRNQQVGWRAVFWDTQSGERRGTGDWVYRRVNPRRHTTFGGGPDAGNGVMITHRQYWQNSQWYDRLADDGDRIKARIEVAWYRSRQDNWIVRRIPVRWVISTSNRTNGAGQTGASSTPINRWTC